MPILGPKPIEAVLAFSCFIFLFTSTEAGLLLAQTGDPDSEKNIDFEKNIAPILSVYCVECHHAKQANGGLNLTDLASASRGGESGQAIVSGDPKSSLLWKRIAAAEMPPEENPPLNKSQKDQIRRWLLSGASWPNNRRLSQYEFSSSSRAGKDWWSLQVIRRPAVPKTGNPQVRNAIDQFVIRKLGRNGLSMSKPASRRVLIRRLSFDLLGLPPTPEAVQAFVNDTDPQAYEKLVDRMLESPHYGERYARHWLDIAHYADTHGFERDKLRPNAWPYRDYVIKSFNIDKGYDRFLREQIAGDVLWPDDPDAVVATGFLAAGPWDFVGQVETRSDVLRRSARALDLDDMVTQVMTATTAMTVNCARCHDHKLDAIPQEDYYRLTAVFAEVKRADRAVSEPERNRAIFSRLKVIKEINRMVPGLDLADIVGGGDGRGTGKFKDGIDPRSGKTERQPMGYLGNVKPNQYTTSTSPFIDGVFIPQSLPDKPKVSIASTGVTVAEITGADGKAWDIIRNGPVNSTHSPKLGGIDFTKDDNSLLGLHANAGITFDLREFRKQIGQQELRVTAQAGYFGARNEHSYADVRVFIDGKKATEFLKLKRADNLQDIDLFLPETARFLTLVATSGGNGIGMDQIAFGNPKIKADPRNLSPEDRNQLSVLQHRKKQLDSKIASLGATEVYAVVPETRMESKIPEVRILKRGNPENPIGDPLPPGALSWVDHLNHDLGKRSTSQAQRRLSLASWITATENPLTRRVIVNRLWQWHFGRGIVSTPSDFGKGGQKPSHPELLDWLADELEREKGSLKAIHRLILTSSAYRQVSHTSHGMKVDAGNQFLWRQSPRRLEAESLRDAVLATTGKLNLKAGGPGFKDFKYTEAYAPIYEYITPNTPELWRRSIYRFVVRTTPHEFLTTLDCPDPANFTPKRLTTTTALQALTLSNNPFMLEQAGYFAERLEREAGPKSGDQIQHAFVLAFGRRPTPEESKAAGKTIQKKGLLAFCHVLLNANEFVYID